MQQLETFFSSHKRININVDNDGVFSSVILKKYYGCDICGFNNNDKIIIHENGINYRDLVYVDLHVGYPDIKSIDQHMVSVDESHNELIKNNLNKINPNVDFDVVWHDYTKKFPFSTTIFLLVKADGEGKNLEDIDLNAYITPKIRLGDLIWQTDSSYDNYFKYNHNAANWLRRLIEISNNGPFTQRLIKYLEEEIPSDFKQRQILSLQIGLWYRETFGCDNNHGGMKDNFIDDSGKITHNLYKYLMSIGNMFGVDNANMKDKEFKQITFKSRRLTHSDYKDRFDSTKLFSYAFIWGMNKDKNISITYE